MHKQEDFITFDLMCGITGIFRANEPLDDGIIKQMTDSLQHRGPDAEGYYRNNAGTCFLGHRRLSIIDLSENANQPMKYKDQGYTIVFNGEIYNHVALREELKAHTADFSTASDTEVVLQAFIQWGDDFVKKLNGMFSIAIYHEKSNHLKLFRDRIGIKPLYYYYHEGVFAFASELKALLPLTKMIGKFHLDMKAVNAYFRLGYIPEPLSIYEEIKKFPAGSEAIVNDAGVEIFSYWDLSQKIEKQVLSDEKKAKIKLGELIQKSVNDRLMSDVPFGTFLSGGIDSSLVTALASRNYQSRLNTFSIGFKEATHDESKYAREVAKQLNTEHHEFIVTHEDALDLIDQHANMFDEPFADSSYIPTHLVAKEARKHVKMVLTGDGGDEQFMGYGMYNWAERLKKYDSPIISPLLKSILSKTSNRGKRVSSMFDRNPNDEIPVHIFSVEQYFFNAREWQKIVKEEIYENIKLPLKDIARKLSAREKQAFFDLNYYLKDDLLVKVDRATMAASLEARTPLLDHRIVSFALNLDEKLKIKNKTNKYLLKQVLYDYLPEKLFDRPKWGFSIPLDQWLGKELKTLIVDTITQDRLDEVGIFKSTEVLQIVDRFFKGEQYLYNKIWLIYVFLSWEEKHRKYLH